ncbi:hypothetical protein PSTT_00880 [Puccinia striiformis]|uniref:Uncharacterized protein n=1 Tax=Puccinia striiformis TaxID=27350 RepID=A0A2S4W5K7_9BASI|nr:hypothetical protein PSTT_00880 [Puccinia striiformis]
MCSNWRRPTPRIVVRDCIVNRQGGRRVLELADLSLGFSSNGSPGGNAFSVPQLLRSTSIAAFSSSRDPLIQLFNILNGHFRNSFPTGKMNVIKATLLVFLAGLSEFAIACSSSEQLGCAHQAGFGDHLYVPSDNHGCLESDEVHYCCRKGALVITSWNLRKELVATKHSCTLSIFSSSCFTYHTFINWQPVNEQIPESECYLPLCHLQNADRIHQLGLAVV